MTKKKPQSQPERTFCLEASKSKLCFPSESKATHYVRHNMSKYRDAASVYYCFSCRCYHLTHYSRRQAESIQQRKEHERLLMGIANQLDEDREF